MKKKITNWMAGIMAFAVAAPAIGQELNVTTTAVPFLRISPDARAGGMGDMGIASAPDANASFWNLAKTPFNKTNTAISLTYTPWLKSIAKDVFLASLGGYYKLDDEQAISLGIRYFNLGKIQFTDFSGQSFGEGNPREFSFDVGYSRKLSQKLGVGVALRYISSDLTKGAPNAGNSKAGTAFSGDISLFHTNLNEAGEGLNWGVTLSNLGSKIGYSNDATKKEYIPANFGAGIAYTKVFDEENKLTFGLDMNKLLVPAPPIYDPNKTQQENQDAIDEYRSYGVFESWFKSFGSSGNLFKTLQFSVGAEYSYLDQFFFRAGYFYEDVTQGNRKFFTLGAGLTYNVFGLNFSYLVPSGSGITKNPLSNTLRFGLVFNLDDIKSGGE